jgi:membrane-associated phospholipid phosphatase
VGVHYPLDVAGGIVVGLLCSAFVVARSPWIPGR